MRGFSEPRALCECPDHKSMKLALLYLMLYVVLTTLDSPAGPEGMESSLIHPLDTSDFFHSF